MCYVSVFSNEKKMDGHIIAYITPCEFEKKQCHPIDTNNILAIENIDPLTRDLSVTRVSFDYKNGSELILRREFFNDSIQTTLGGYGLELLTVSKRQGWKNVLADAGISFVASMAVFSTIEFAYSRSRRFNYGKVLGFSVGLTALTFPFILFEEEHSYYSVLRVSHSP